MRHVTQLEATYYSEPINETYYTFKLTSVDHNSGKIIGQCGKGQYLGSDFTGWLGWQGGVPPYTVFIDFEADGESALLYSDDKEFDRLYGKLYRAGKSASLPDFPKGDEQYDIVFNKDKAASTPQPSTNVTSG